MSRSGCSIRSAAVDQQPDRPGTDHYDPVAGPVSTAALRAGRSTRARPAPPAATGRPRSRCSWDSWATSDSAQPPPTASEIPEPGAWHPVTPASSNRSHAYGRPSRQVRHGSNPRCTHDRIGSNTTRSPSATVRPAASVDDPDHLVPGDRAGLGVERGQHERRLGVRQPHVAAADPAQLGLASAATRRPSAAPARVRRSRGAASRPVPTRRTSRPRGAASARLRSAGSAGVDSSATTARMSATSRALPQPGQGRVSRSTRTAPDGCARASFMALM